MDSLSRGGEGAERPRVLVVDDEAGARRSLEALLEDEFDVVSVGSVLEAKTSLASAPFEVLLTDYEMPGGSGLTLLRRVTSLYPWILCVLVTGHRGVPEIEALQAKRREVRVVIKPYDPLLLIGWVRNAASLSRLRQATRRLRGDRLGSE